MRALTMVGLAALCAGCAIKPLPQDVTGNDTYQIVQKISVKRAIWARSFILGMLDNQDAAVAQKLRSGTLTFANVNRKALSPDDKTRSINMIRRPSRTISRSTSRRKTTSPRARIFCEHSVVDRSRLEFRVQASDSDKTSEILVATVLVRKSLPPKCRTNTASMGDLHRITSTQLPDR